MLEDDHYILSGGANPAPKKRPNDAFFAVGQVYWAFGDG